MSGHPHHHEVQVREVALPGAARLFHVTLSSGDLVAIRTDPSSPHRHLSVTHAGSEETVVSVRCTAQEATTLAALLSGVRFVVLDGADDQPVDAANLRTLTLPAGSPVVGRVLDELELPDPDDAQVIAVIRDDTPDLVEDDPERPLVPGDRLVLVGRPGSMGRLVRHLLG